MKKIILKYKEYSLNENVGALLDPYADIHKENAEKTSGEYVKDYGLRKASYDGIDDPELIARLVHEKTVAGFKDPNSLSEEVKEAKKKLSEALFSFYKEPSLLRWVALLSNVNIYVTIDPRYQTAWTDCIDTIWFNPFFINTLTREAVAGIVLHELYHILWDHNNRAKADVRRTENHWIWNVSADYALNFAITLEDSYITNTLSGKHTLELPDGACISSYFSYMSADVIFDILYAKIKKVPKPPKGPKPLINEPGFPPNDGEDDGEGEEIDISDLPEDVVEKLKEEAKNRKQEDFSPGKKNPPKDQSTPVQHGQQKQNELDDYEKKLEEKIKQMREKVEKAKQDAKNKKNSNDNSDKGKSEDSNDNDSDSGNGSGKNDKDYKKTFKPGDIVKDDQGNKYIVEIIEDDQMVRVRRIE